MMSTMISPVSRLVAALVVVIVSLGVVGFGDRASAQTPTSVPAESCVPGATIPVDRPANGPSPVGRCEPTGRQRVIDTLVWFWVLGLMALLAVVGLLALRRQPSQ